MTASVPVEGSRTDIASRHSVLQYQLNTLERDLRELLGAVAPVGPTTRPRDHPSGCSKMRALGVAILLVPVSVFVAVSTAAAATAATAATATLRAAALGGTAKMTVFVIRTNAIPSCINILYSCNVSLPVEPVGAQISGPEFRSAPSASGSHSNAEHLAKASRLNFVGSVRNGLARRRCPRIPCLVRILRRGPHRDRPVRCKPARMDPMLYAHNARQSEEVLPPNLDLRTGCIYICTYVCVCH